MHAIILAAGVGKRLNTAHAAPKCLLELAGKSLLERHFEHFDTLPIDHVSLCLGYESQAVAEAIPARWRDRTLIQLNPLYRLGSVVSLWSMRQVLAAGVDVLLMDADVLYDHAILERLVAREPGNLMLLDRDFVPGDEPVKICLDGGRIVEFRKQLDPGLRYTDIGESVGFFRFTPSMALELCSRTAAYVADGRREAPHEEVLRDLVLDVPAGFEVEDVSGLAWIEIDFPDDIERATRDVLPRINDKSD